MALLTFIETSIFTKSITNLFDDNEYQQIQKELLNNPEKGDLIQDTGGLRKIRFGRNGGKRSGVRILYYHANEHHRIYLLAVYPKSLKDNITDAEKQVFKTLISILKQELNSGQTLI